MSCYRAALALARRGIPVFPCRPGRKEPLTGRGFKDASTDPAVVERWFRQWPRANLAIPTGLRSGLAVLDLDVKHGEDGRATLAELERVTCSLPETLTVATPSGGEHRYFRMPQVALHNSASRLGPGVDTRAEGGYVLVPPSVVEGKAYRWTAHVPLADLPAQWLAVLMPPTRAAEPTEPWAPRDNRERSRAARWCTTALQREARELADTPAGARNDRLWRAAAALGGLVHFGAIDAKDVRRALLWACSTWERRDARKDHDTVSRALTWGVAHPRQIHLGDDRAA